MSQHKDAFIYLLLICELQAMAAPDFIKPFSPEETQRILGNLQQPAVFVDMTCDWPVLSWTAERLSESLRDKLVRFRLGRKDETKSKKRKGIRTDMGLEYVLCGLSFQLKCRKKADFCDKMIITSKDNAIAMIPKFPTYIFLNKPIVEHEK